jgi:hypothetical protein
MVIALERYLIPMISKNQMSSYQSALVRICTTLTKGWFRQFAIDNYPRLLNLDKELLSIAHDIINNHPLQEKKLNMWTLDPETCAIFESINSHTKVISNFDDIEGSSGDNSIAERTGFKIISPLNNKSITIILTNIHSYSSDSCHSSARWSASVVILPSEDFELFRYIYNIISRKLCYLLCIFIYIFFINIA